MAQEKQNQHSPSQPGRLACKPQKILVPIDFSENCKKALPYAQEYAAQFNAKLYLAHVLEPPPMLSDFRDVPLALPEKEVLVNVREELLALATSSLKASDLAEIIVRKGKPYQDIVTLASELGIDLIIMATHGYTGLKHTLLGSTTERVVRHAPCPVLVVRS